VGDRPGGTQLELRVTRNDDPVVRRLDAEVQAEYVALYGGPDESAIEPGAFDPPDGVFLVGWVDGRPVACGALRRHDAITAEVKRMFVSIPVRGRGYARAVLAALEDRARAVGYREVRLETGLFQPAAIALYESSGYRPVQGFGHYRDSPLSRCFAKTL